VPYFAERGDLRWVKHENVGLLHHVSLISASQLGISHMNHGYGSVGNGGYSTLWHLGEKMMRIHGGWG
jgi:hypothetical protein